VPEPASNKIEDKVTPMPADVISNTTSSTVPPQEIHNCPNCSHWLTEGTLACPDCQTLTYGAHLSDLASQAQQNEQQGQWKEARELWQQALQWLPADTRQAVSIQNHIAQIDSRLKTEDDRKARWTKRLGPFAPIALFLLKAKSFLFVILKFKFLLSFLLYFGFYAALGGWMFAVALTVSVLVHEMGHFIAAKQRGLRVDLPFFLPGFGAYVRWYGQGVSVKDAAFIALAGPMAGLLCSLASFAIYASTQHHHPFFLYMAWLGAWINLANLFPVAFRILTLDGALAAFDLTKMQRGLIALTCLFFFGLTVAAGEGNFQSPIVHWVFLAVGLGMLWRVFVPDAPEKPSTRTFAIFQGLVIVLGALAVYTFTLLLQLQLVQ
jgi:Zn-dependent protease